MIPEIQEHKPVERKQSVYDEWFDDDGYSDIKPINKSR